MITLAEIPTNPNATSLGESLLVIGFILGLLMNIITIWALLRNRKEQRVISFEFDPASKSEFEEQKKHCTKRHGELFEAVDLVKEKAAIDLKETARLLEEKIDDNQNALTEKLRVLPNEIVAQLINTKNLWRQS
jgi:uncharacterized membrane-anchored protein YhcB (DUF1043 family)